MHEFPSIRIDRVVGEDPCGGSYLALHGIMVSGNPVEMFLFADSFIQDMGTRGWVLTLSE